MLVLTRKISETVILQLEDGREIVVSLVDVRSKERVRLGFEADTKIKIIRSELKGKK